MKKRWGTAIRLQRRVAGLSQKQLADALGLDQSTVSYWETGAKAPSLDHQLAIARALKVDARVLFTYPELAAS